MNKNKRTSSVSLISLKTQDKISGLPPSEGIRVGITLGVTTRNRFASRTPAAPSPDGASPSSVGALMSSFRSNSAGRRAMEAGFSRAIPNGALHKRRSFSQIGRVCDTSSSGVELRNPLKDERELSEEAQAICGLLNEYRLPRAIVHLGRDRFIAWNVSFQERTGYTAEQLHFAHFPNQVLSWRRTRSNLRPACTLFVAQPDVQARNTSRPVTQPDATTNSSC